MFKGPQTVIFFGSSGSGKGTQAGLLREYFKKVDPQHKVIYIETGRRLREFMEEANYTAELTKETIDDGGLLPEFMPIWVWTEHLVRNFSGKEHLILDGLSRREQEAPILESALEFYNLEPIYIVHLKTSKEWSTQRLLERGRDDDTRQNIEERLEWFYENTLPAIKHLKQNIRHTYIEVDGEQTIEDVHSDIISVFKQ